jgi:hypothetical protein
MICLTSWKKLET